MIFRTDNGHIVPTVTTEQMRKVDRLAVAEFNLGILQMMENAGRSLAENAIDMIGTLPDEITVLAGSGGNGGGALCSARHLHNRGVKVNLILDRNPTAFEGAAADQLRVLLKAGLQPTSETMIEAVLQSADLVIDGLIGYGLKETPREETARLILLCNEFAVRTLSNDIPSGMDATTGKAPGPIIRADRILTLAAPKSGLVNNRQPLFLADIGIPPVIFRRLRIDFPSPFEERYWLRLVEE